MGGDINAYFLESDAPFFWPDREDMKTPRPAVPLGDLWRFLDSTGRRYFTVPHHTGRARKWRSYADPDYDPQREPLFEIYSAWGSSERRWNRFPLRQGNNEGPCYFRDALLAGCRYGVIASSDDHTTLPGGESRMWGTPLGPKCLDGHTHHGLAAVRAKELTREALFASLSAKNCYGTTFDRTLLDVRIGDASMGQAVSVGKNDLLHGKRQVRVRLLSAEGWARVTLVRNGDDVEDQAWQLKEDREVVFEDAETLDRIAVRGARHHPEPFVVYYVRVVNSRDQTQWSSPIWLDLRG
jgi:hypothetical protein